MEFSFLFGHWRPPRLEAVPQHAPTENALDTPLIGGDKTCAAQAPLKTCDVKQVLKTFKSAFVLLLIQKEQRSLVHGLAVNRKKSK